MSGYRHPLSTVVLCIQRVAEPGGVAYSYARLQSSVDRTCARFIVLFIPFSIKRYGPDKCMNPRLGFIESGVEQDTSEGQGEHRRCATQPAGYAVAGSSWVWFHVSPTLTKHSVFASAAHSKPSCLPWPRLRNNTLTSPENLAPTSQTVTSFRPRRHVTED